MQETYYWADFSRFGLYLLPKPITEGYGISEPSLFVLLFDKLGHISERAKDAYLTPLFKIPQSDGCMGVVYLMQPYFINNQYRYIDSSELLHRLHLSSVASSVQSSLPVLTENFKNAVGHVAYQQLMRLLFKSYPLLTNLDNHQVLESPLGRFIFNKTDATPAQLFYALKPESNKQNSQIEWVVDDNALLDISLAFLRNSFVKNKQLIENLCRLIFLSTPKGIEVGDKIDLSPFILTAMKRSETVNIQHYIKFMMSLRAGVGAMLSEIHDHTPTIALFYYLLDIAKTLEAKRDYIHASYCEQVFVPPQIALCLRFLLGVNAQEVLIASCASASLVMLFKEAGIVAPQRSLQDHLSLINNKYQLGLSIGSSMPKQIFQNTIAVVPLGNNPISVTVPIVNSLGRSLAQATVEDLGLATIINSLQLRTDIGRSVFLLMLDKEQLGELDWNFYSWLQSYYQDVTVVDIDAKLFCYDENPSYARLVVVGSATEVKPESLEQYNSLLNRLPQQFKVPLINDINELIRLTETIAVQQLSYDYLRKHIEKNDSSLTIGMSELNAPNTNLITHFEQITPTEIPPAIISFEPTPAYDPFSVLFDGDMALSADLTKKRTLKSDKKSLVESEMAVPLHGQTNDLAQDVVIVKTETTTDISDDNIVSSIPVDLKKSDEKEIDNNVDLVETSENEDTVISPIEIVSDIVSDSETNDNVAMESQENNETGDTASVNDDSDNETQDTELNLENETTEPNNDSVLEKDDNEVVEETAIVDDEVYGHENNFNGVVVSDDDMPSYDEPNNDNDFEEFEDDSEEFIGKTMPPIKSNSSILQSNAEDDMVIITTSN